jgi:hypothetical protein
MSRRRPVRVFGGPLDGGLYDLDVDPGALIELNSPAGVCTYQFRTSDGGEPILNYIGSGPRDGKKRKNQHV